VIAATRGVRYDEVTHVSIVAALAETGVIGVGNRLPWHLPADLRHFRELTMGKPVLMGRRTHESIGRPLPGRLNLVLTRDASYDAPGCRVVGGFDEALAGCADAPEVMVIGGAAVYARALPHATRLYLTRVQQPFAGDVYFPAYAEEEWSVRDRDPHPADSRNPWPYVFVTLERVGPRP